MLSDKMQRPYVSIVIPTLNEEGNIERVLKEVKRVLSTYRYEIIVVAEGAKPAGTPEIVKENGIDSFGHKTLGGVGEFLAKRISEWTKIETRSLPLSHLQRGGVPCAYDRRMGRYFGIAAVDLIVNEDFGRMVSYRNGRITSVPLREAVSKLNLVDVRTQYDTERYNGRRTILGT